MKGINIALAIVAGLGGVIAAVVGFWLITATSGILMMILSILLAVAGLASVGLGVWSTR